MEIKAIVQDIDRMVREMETRERDAREQEEILNAFLRRYANEQAARIRAAFAFLRHSR